MATTTPSPPPATTPLPTTPLPTTPLPTTPSPTTPSPTTPSPTTPSPTTPSPTTPSPTTPGPTTPGPTTPGPTTPTPTTPVPTTPAPTTTTVPTTTAAPPQPIQPPPEYFPPTVTGQIDKINIFEPSVDSNGTGYAFLLPRTKDYDVSLEYEDVYGNAIYDQIQLVQKEDIFEYDVSLYTTGESLTGLGNFVSGLETNLTSLTYNFTKEKNIIAFNNPSGNRYYQLLFNVKNNNLTNDVVATIYHLPANIVTVAISDFISDANLVNQLNINISFDSASPLQSGLNIADNDLNEISFYKYFKPTKVDIYTGASTGNAYDLSGFSYLKSQIFFDNSPSQTLTITDNDVPANEFLFYKLLPYDDFGSGLVYGGIISGFIYAPKIIPTFDEGIPPKIQEVDRTGYFTGLNAPQRITGLDGALLFETGQEILYFLKSGQWQTIKTYEELTGVFITGDTSSFATTGYVTGVSGYLQDQINSITVSTGDFITTGQTGAFAAAAGTGAFLTTGAADGRYALQSATGDFITTGQTGQFYPNNNPSGYITGVDLSSYATTAYVTGASGYLQNQITNLNNATGSYVTTGQTGDFITTGQTGQFYPITNPSGFLVSGSPVDLVHAYVKNDQGATVYKGQAVYINGANGTNALINLASNTGETTSSKTLGLLAQNLAVNEFGYVVTEGILEGIDTSSGNAGDPIWLGTGGNLIYGLANKPYGNNHLVYLGVVLRSQSNNGKVYVKVQNGFEIQELHRVYAKDAEDYSTLIYDSGSGSWFARQMTTGDVSGISNYALKTETGAFLTTGAADGRYYQLSNGQSISGYAVTGYNQSITGLEFSGTTTKTLFLYQRNGQSISGSFVDGGGGGTDVVYTTGNQTISGVKDFQSRPTVLTTGVLLSGEALLLTQTGQFVITGQTGAFLTTGEADLRYVNTTGDIVSGQIHISGGVATSNQTNLIVSQTWNAPTTGTVFTGINVNISGLTHANKSALANFSYNGQDILQIIKVSGGYSGAITFGSSSQSPALIHVPSIAGRAATIAIGTNVGDGIVQEFGGNIVTNFGNGNGVALRGGQGVDMGGTATIAWQNGASPLQNTQDTYIGRQAAAVIRFGNNGTTKVDQTITAHHVTTSGGTGASLILTAGTGSGVAGVTGEVRISGRAIALNVRPTVNGTGVLLSGEGLENAVLLTGNQLISGNKTFADKLIAPTGFFGFSNVYRDVNYQTIGGGAYNEISGNSAVIGGGYNNTIRSNYGFIGGGVSNTILTNSDYSLIVGGLNNEATAQYAVAGGRFARSDRFAARAFSSILPTSAGQSQHIQFVLNGSSYDTGVSGISTLSLDGNGLYFNILENQTDKVMMATIKVLGVDEDANISQFMRKAVISTLSSNAGAHRIHHLESIGTDMENAGKVIFSVTGDFNTGAYSGIFCIFGSGISGQNTRWIADVDAVEIILPPAFTPATTTTLPPPLAYNFTVYSECATYGTPITIYSNSSSLVYGDYYYADIYGLTPLNGVTYYGGNTPGTHARYVFSGGQLVTVENSCTIDPPPPPATTSPP